MAVLDTAIQKKTSDFNLRLDCRVKPTAVRFNLVDAAHDIDSTPIQSFRDGLDTKRDQCHAA
jgi:hypothetical protein